MTDAGPSAEYRAFFSYAHAADGAPTPQLRAGLQRFAKPWWRRELAEARDAVPKARPRTVMMPMTVDRMRFMVPPGSEAGLRVSGRCLGDCARLLTFG